MTKPMLSATLDDLSKVVFPVLVSPKLDGIRCLIIDGKPVSRNFKEIPNRAIFEELTRLRLPPLDGELIVGSAKADDCYRKTNSGVMSRDGEPDWTFWVFDIVDDGAFEYRIRRVKELVKVTAHKRIRIVPHVEVMNAEHLERYEANHLLSGYEGVMGRSLDGRYKHGRSTLREGALWKLKRFSDGEARILGFEEQMRNDNEAKRDALGRIERSSHKENKHGKGTLGAIKVEDLASGVRFDIGTGFSDLERQTIWDSQADWRGRIVKYKSLPVGVKEKPRHPAYLGTREDL